MAVYIVYLRPVMFGLPHIVTSDGLTLGAPSSTNRAFCLVYVCSCRRVLLRNDFKKWTNSAQPRKKVSRLIEPCQWQRILAFQALAG